MPENRGFEIPDDIKPLELRELLDKNLDQISPKDEKETYLIHILKEFRPDELYDEQMKELLLWGRRAVSVECQYSTVTSCWDIRGSDTGFFRFLWRST